MPIAIAWRNVPALALRCLLFGALLRSRPQVRILLGALSPPALLAAPRSRYFIVDCPPDATRAEHANSNHSAIIALNSSVTVEVDNGSERGTHRLTDPDSALIVRAGVWMRLREFSRETCVVVLSSKPWEETQHFAGPEPTLLDHAGP